MDADEPKNRTEKLKVDHIGMKIGRKMLKIDQDFVPAKSLDAKSYCNVSKMVVKNKIGVKTNDKIPSYMWLHGEGVRFTLS